MRDNARRIEVGPSQRSAHLFLSIVFSVGRCLIDSVSDLVSELSIQAFPR